MMKLPSKGWGPWRREWYSVHSSIAKAMDPSNGAGVWRLVWVQAIDSWIYRRCKPFWLWWHNRPNSFSRRRLQRLFPNLK